MTLYIDMVFIENFVINFFLLQAVTIILRLKIKNIRLLISSMIGGLYVIAMIVWPNRLYSLFISKIVLSGLMILVSFSKESMLTMIKAYILFILSSFVLGGIILAFSGTVNNMGLVSIKSIVFSVLLLLIIFSLLRELIMKKYKNCDYKIKIYFLEKSITIPALVDTGNFLTEPISKTPVIIVETPVLEDFLPDDIYKVLNKGEWYENNSNQDKWTAKIRYIPYNTIDNENKLMAGFEPDYVEIWGGDLPEIRKKAVIGMCNNALNKNKSFKALINPALMD